MQNVPWHWAMSGRQASRTLKLKMVQSQCKVGSYNEPGAQRIAIYHANNRQIWDCDLILSWKWQLPNPADQAYL